MGKMCGWTIVLIIFGGIIIQCESSPTWRLVDHPFLTQPLIDLIISKTEYKTIKDCIDSGIIHPGNVEIGELLDKTIVLINPDMFDDDEQKIYLNEDGDVFLELRSHVNFVMFFEDYGDKVRKIEVVYRTERHNEHRDEINEIIQNCAKNLDELRIACHDDDGIWDQLLLSNEGNFPNVKKFHFTGNSKRNELKLNSIFPKLESVKLVGAIKDENCLANVKNLKELELYTDSIQEKYLFSIFSRNENMIKLSLSKCEVPETLGLISQHLTNLQTFNLEFPGWFFLYRFQKEQYLYTLPSVTQFNIKFAEMKEIVRDSSIDMPSLRSLGLTVMSAVGKASTSSETNDEEADNRAYVVIDFIAHFKKLESVKLILPDEYCTMKCLKKFKKIKQFTINNFGDKKLTALRNVLEDMDETYKLQTLKITNVRRRDYPVYEKTMKEINGNLENFLIPTWAVSQEKQDQHGQIYVVLKRQS